MDAAKYLIVNADDFGRSAGINRGVIEAYERGIVTSASLMVDRPGAAEAAGYARAHPKLSVGLHIEVPETSPRFLGRLRGRRPVERPRDVVADDVHRQLDRFDDLVGRPPTHLDSHRHRHRGEPLRSVAIAAARELGIPLRQFDPRIRYCGDFYGQVYGRVRRLRPNPDGISTAALIEIFEGLAPGVTELCAHPGYVDDLDSRPQDEPYRTERPVEAQTLCDPRVRAALDERGIELRSFDDFASDPSSEPDLR